MKKLLYIFLGLSLMFGCSDDDDNSCVYQPTIVTLNASDITDFSATLNGTINVESTNCDSPNNTEQGFVYSTTIQPTINDNIVNVNGIDISASLDNLEPDTTYYYRAFLTNTLGEFYGSEISFETTDDSNPVYLDDNGVTIKAKDWAEVGMSGEINGFTYTIVDSDTLAEMIANEEDITAVCTSKITLMTDMFYESQFNQDIGNWDVSSVTSMSRMFAYAPFNQDISNWDVSSVTSVSSMFLSANYFNQPIGDWDVSSVTDMGEMFTSAFDFNQPIGDWDVSSVTDMNYMFGRAFDFNQPIGDWDVSSVTSMSRMFYDTPFNQPIVDWDVSNVTDMSYMFAYAPFNQDISNWDVSSVTNMIAMFRNSSFNQPIGDWDVSNVTDMSYMFVNAESFNQNIGSLDVSNVTYCENFAFNTPSWTLPQPNFTNCNPD